MRAWASFLPWLGDERFQEPALFGGPPNGYGIGDRIARLALWPRAVVT